MAAQTRLMPIARRVEHRLVPVEDGVVAQGAGGPQGTCRQSEPDET
jgi:hypothetical protein